MHTMNIMKMTTKRLGQFLRFQPTVTWRGELIGAVASAGTVVLLILLQRTVTLSAGWYWTVFAAGVVTMLVLITIAQRRWDKPKPPQDAQEGASADTLNA